MPNIKQNVPKGNYIFLKKANIFTLIMSSDSRISYGYNCYYGPHHMKEGKNQKYLCCCYNILTAIGLALVTSEPLNPVKYNCESPLSCHAGFKRVFFSVLFPVAHVSRERRLVRPSDRQMCKK